MQEPEERHEPGAGDYVLIIALVLLLVVVAVLVLNATGVWTTVGTGVSNL